MGFPNVLRSAHTISLIFAFLLVGPCFSSSANAAASDNAAPRKAAYVCDLSGSDTGDVTGCGGAADGSGYLTTTAAVKGNGTCTDTSFCGARSFGTAVAPIDAWGRCRWVDNAGNNSLFVPFRSDTEWLKFEAAAQQIEGVEITHCARPYAETGAPATATAIAPYEDCTTVTADAPDVYGRTDISRWPEPALSQDFTCHDGATSMQSLLQWLASDADMTPQGSLSWKPANLFSPDLALQVTEVAAPANTGTSIVIKSSADVDLSWSTAGQAGQTWECTASDGWSGSKAFDGGSERVTPMAEGRPDNTVPYTLACTDNNGLTSTARVTVKVSGGSGACSFDVIHIGDSLGYNLFNDLKAHGCDMTKPVKVTAIVDPGALLGGSGAGAFSTGTGYVAGSELKLIVSAGSYIVGSAGNGANGGYQCESGGRGGTAFNAAYPITITNLGTIAGGGGGGSRRGCNNCNWMGTGGGGAVSGGGPGAGVGFHGSRQATVATMRTGSGWGGSNWNTPGKGVGGGLNGGAWGQPGKSIGQCVIMMGRSSRTENAVGGAAGYSVVGNSFITWANTGTILGPIK